MWSWPSRSVSSAVPLSRTWSPRGSAKPSSRLTRGLRKSWHAAPRAEAAGRVKLVESKSGPKLFLVIKDEEMPVPNPSNLRLRVKEGDKVGPGDQLTEG